MPREPVIRSDRLRVPVDLARLYLQQFGGSYPAASRASGLAMPVIKRLIKGDFVDEDVAELFLQACRSKLGKTKTEAYLMTDRDGVRTQAAQAILTALDELYARGEPVSLPGEVAVSYQPPEPPEQQQETAKEPAADSDLIEPPLLVCSKCGEQHPPTPEYFSRKRKDSDDVRAICLNCLRGFARRGGRERWGIKGSENETNMDEQERPLPPPVATTGADGISADVLLLDLHGVPDEVRALINGLMLLVNKLRTVEDRTERLAQTERARELLEEENRILWDEINSMSGLAEQNNSLLERVADLQRRNNELVRELAARKEGRAQ